MLGLSKRFFRRKSGSPPILNANEKLASPHPDFDESLYLTRNPDVAAWVKSSRGLSGWRYFVDQGYLENRAGASQSVCRHVRLTKTYEIDEGLPPAFLRKRVHGSEDVDSFESVGR